MKKKRLLLALLLLIGSSRFFYAQDIKGKTQEYSIAPPQEKIRIGEKLKYSVEWLGIPVMKVTLSVQEVAKLDGRECYHLEAVAQPNAFFRLFYDVEHKMDSYIDTKNFSPVRFEKKRCEKNKCADLIIEFHQDKSEARVTTYRSVDVKIPTNTQDLLSCLYYFRRLEIKEGQTYSANILYGEKNWPISVTVKTPYLMDIRKKGTFSVIEISPSADLIEHLLNKRKAQAYFTADSNRIPLLFTLSTRFGVLRGALQELPE
jgi:hypothetical protein